ncbi:MAG: hypothetical protein K2L12_07970 [Clostridia bacterium]|nr:hypothetical protein [Clostridia bacterium]
MKLSKIKSVLLALAGALILAVLCFGLVSANGVKAYADDGDGVSLSGYQGKNFVYSAEFTPADGNAKEAGLVFGAADDLTIYWAAIAGIKEGKVILLHSEDGQLKTADYAFDAGETLKITLVMNEEIAKIFIGNSDVAVICCKLDGYNGGKVGQKLNGGFTVSNVKFTDIDIPEGNIFCNGYDVLKVVNLTDGNRKLESGEYKLENGILTVSPEYLRTLESSTEYVFRVVTSFTDLDFKITTDFTSVTVTSSVEKYYRDDEVTLELSGNIKVHKLLIDGKECKFTQQEDAVKISSEEIGSLSTGSHNVKLYTDKGRPETTINVSEKVETVSEPVIKSTHVWLWIDLAIFLSAIIGYVAFSVISKRKKH